MWTDETSGSSNKHILRGSSKSYIHFDQDIQSWKLSLYDTNNTFAILQGNEIIYPFGQKLWRIVNDSCNYDSLEKRNEVSRKLSFDSCKSDEFNCNDGTW